MSSSRLRHLLFFVGLVALAAVVWSYTQPQLVLLDGKGYDGREYSAIYQRLQGTALLDVDFPFCQRLGVPWLAAHLPVNEARGFLWVNLVAGAAALVFCFLALLERVSPAVAWASIVVMLVGIFNPIRFSFYDPFNVDAPVMACYAVAIWLFGRRQFVWSIALLAASNVFKESGVYFAALFACYAVAAVPAARRRRTAIVLASVCAAGVVMTRLLAMPFCGPGSALWLVMTNVFIHVRSPWGILATVAGISLTAGPFLFACWYRGAHLISLALLRSPFYAAGVLAAIMAFAGGSDVTRIFFLAYPLYVFHLADRVRAMTGLERVLLLSAGVTANRLLERLPDPVLPAADPNVKSFFNFTPDHSAYSVALTILAFWVLTYAVVDRCTAALDARKSGT